MTKRPSGKIAGRSKIAVTVTPRVRNHKTRPKEQELRFSETGWIGALDAALLVSVHDGNLDSAKSLLVDYLQEGKLTCRAYCWSQEADVGSILLHQIEWSGHKTAREHAGQCDKTVFCEPVGDASHIDLPRDLFLSSNGWMISSEDARWEDGYFIARKPAELLSKPARASANKPMIRRFTTGLEFHVTELSALIRRESETSAPNGEADGVTQGSQRSSRGRKRGPLWGPWHAEIVIYAFQEGIDTDMTIKDFYEAIAPRMASRKLLYPDLGSADKEIGAIFSRWREARLNGEIGDRPPRAI